MLNCNTATVQELQVALDKGAITSVALVEQCLNQIHRHNHDGRHLHAIISTPTHAKLIAVAASLDNERKNGDTRSPLHGIPIIIKDNILTDSELGMDTTAGSIGLVGATSSRNALLVDRLLQAGMIVLGKANLTEFAGLKNHAMTPGWSAVGGQTRSPFIEGRLQDKDGLLGHTSAAGSSSGSAVGVTAGFAPLAIGTETIGSVILPAGRAGIYAFRAGFGTVPMDHILPLSPDFDMIGIFGRCTKDLEELASYLIDKPDLLAIRPGVSWGERMRKVAFADPKEWKLDEKMCPADNPELLHRQQIDAYESAVAQLGGRVVTRYPVKLPNPNSVPYELDGEKYGIVSVSFHQLRGLIDSFLRSFDNCKVRSLQELISYNDAHAHEAFCTACPNQDDLHKVQDDSSDPTLISKALEHIKHVGRSGLDNVFETEAADLIAAPSDSFFALLTAAAGYPAGVVPFPTVLEPYGRPFGLAIVAKPGREVDLFRFMAIWERVVCPHRPIPPFLKNEDELPMKGT